VYLLITASSFEKEVALHSFRNRQKTSFTEMKEV
jgi:hypothetical protein